MPQGSARDGAALLMQITANGVALEVDIQGPASGRPLLMIMGLGMQLLAWPQGLVDLLVRSGFRVIRFDSRDIGLSQSFKTHGTPNLMLEWVRHGVGLSVRSPYALSDMADDSAALLGALGLDSADICAASMGGMVAQHLAARHPERVRSLTLMMTTSGARGLPGPSWKVRHAMLKRPPVHAGEPAQVRHLVQLFRLIGSPGYPAPPAGLEQRVTAALRRSQRPDGVLRQMVAILADGDRSAMLPAIAAPTQIIHGAADPLLPAACGRDLAARINGAELDVIDGMGHDLPSELWPRFAADIRSAAERAG
ncbi:alpha/beta fold hydrolase [Piscinibacter sakaiensis]|uniref:alpha/beta fold hydrolase n=1 Tax=Piscinibacter sakaiensis TaxID=1547922 RepID=UPI003AB0B7FA